MREQLPITLAHRSIYSAACFEDFPLPNCFFRFWPPFSGRSAKTANWTLYTELWAGAD